MKARWLGIGRIIYMGIETTDNYDSSVGESDRELE